MSFTVSLDQQQLTAVQDTLGFIKNGTNRATMRAANVGAARAKAEAGRQLKALLTAPAKRITDSLRVSKRATLSDTSAVFTDEGKAIKLVYFNHDGSMFRSDSGGIIADIFKMGGNPLQLKHGFLAKMQSGHIGIFTRKGPKRRMMRGNYVGEIKQPIVEHFGPNAATALEKTPGKIQYLMDYAMGKFIFELDRQVVLLFQKEYGIDPPEDWND
jgi:hypothetical protein